MQIYYFIFKVILYILQFHVYQVTSSALSRPYKAIILEINKRMCYYMHKRKLSKGKETENEIYSSSL